MRHLKPLRRHPAFGFVFALAAVLLGTRVDARGDESDDLFRGTNLLCIRIEIPAEGIQALRRPRRDFHAKASATVTEGGIVYSNVHVHLKGRGTFQPIDARPSLTLNFGDATPKKSFHGLTKFSLNNSAQDPTCLQEKLARELFLAAGVPAARADNALITLNGRDLGVYVLTEGFDKRFLKRHFERADGSFFDGGLFTDLDQPLQVTTGEADYSSLQRVVAASREPDPRARYEALDQTLDLDRFISLLAMEVILCHWDGYGMRRTNYRAYHDPATGKVVILPQGMDRILGNFRRHLDLSLLPPMPGLAARALLDTPQGRARYLERAGSFLTNLFQPEKLANRVHEMDRKISETLQPTSSRWTTNPYDVNRVASSGGHQRDVDDLCERIATRARYLKNHFANLLDSSKLAPALKFNTNGTARLPAWSQRAAYLTPEALVERVNDNGKELWHITAPGPYTAVGCRVSLPAGRYTLRGDARVAGGPAPPRLMLRHFGMPFTPEFQSTEWRLLTVQFEIAHGPAPEQVDLMCEIRGKGEVWLDLDSFRLTSAFSFE